jgi:gas vesicle structural protein
MNMAVSRHMMAVGQQPVAKMGESAGLAELVGVILDKGIVIDAWARVSVLGLELLTIEARMVVASVDTYLRYAEAIGLTAPAAPPPRQRAACGGENEHDRVLEGQVLRRLSEHPEGLQPDAMQALLDAPREQVRETLSHLAEEHKVRWDEDHNRYLPEEYWAIALAPEQGSAWRKVHRYGPAAPSSPDLRSVRTPSRAPYGTSRPLRVVAKPLRQGGHGQHGTCGPHG